MTREQSLTRVYSFKANKEFQDFALYLFHVQIQAFFITGIFHYRHFSLQAFFMPCTPLPKFWLCIKTAHFLLLYAEDFEDFQFFHFPTISTIFGLRQRDFHASKPSGGWRYLVVVSNFGPPKQEPTQHPLSHQVIGPCWLEYAPHIYSQTIQCNLDFHLIPSSNTTQSV